MDDGKIWLVKLEGSSEHLCGNFLMANVIVLLSEVVSRPEYQAGNDWQYSGQLGPLFGFFNDNFSSVNISSLSVSPAWAW